MLLREGEIGGGTVRRTFKFGDEQVFSGKTLTADQILGMPINNRRALIEKGYISVYPKAPDAPAAKREAKGERHVVSAGFGRFDVIEGVKLNEASLSKDEAMELAGKVKKKSRSKK